MTSDDANKYGLYQGEASEMHMRLNQQLWTYFERIGKKPNTIRKIFEQGRTPDFGYLSMIRRSTADVCTQRSKSR